VSRRAQLVLVAAALVAVALGPILLAYLQLGYHADVQATGDYSDPTAEVTRVLDRTVSASAADVTGEYDWADRDAAVTALRTALTPRIRSVERSAVERGTVHNVTYNQSTARTWAARNCPDGPDRQFGACEADRGVVVQDRLGETHVLAVAADVRTTTERGTREVTVVLRVVG